MEPSKQLGDIKHISKYISTIIISMGSGKNHVIVAFFFLVFILVELGSQVEARSLQESLMYEEFEGWVKENRRTYKDGEEKANRFMIYKENVHHIDSFNAAGNQSYKLSVNPFTDLTNEEFKATRNGLMTNLFPKNAKHNSFKYANFTNVPPNVDWRDKGAVTPIKDQKQCGT